MTTDSGMFREWAVLELMGHRRLAGLVTEEERFSTKLIRIDIPQGDGFTTQWYSASALYCMTPTTEEIARNVARSNQPAPVHRWELPAPATSPVVTTGHYDDLDDDETGYRESDNANTR